MSRILELMGLPGSGKSTVAEALLRDIRRLGGGWQSKDDAIRRCLRHRDDGLLRNLLKRLPHVVWEPLAGSRHAMLELHAFASTHVPLWQLWLEVMNRQPMPEAWRQCVLYAFFMRCIERQLLDAHLRDDEGVVVEEGFALGVITMLGCLPPGTPCESDVDRYVRHMPAPEAVIWIDADPDTCEARLRQRPVMPLLWEHCSDAELRAQLAYGRHCFELAARAFERRGIPVCRVPNPDGGGEEARRAVLRFCSTQMPAMQ